MGNTALGTLFFLVCFSCIADELPAERLLPTPRGRDHDPVLTALARDLTPITSAIDGFIAQRGRCPSLGNTADLANLKNRLPSGLQFRAERAALYIGVAITYSQSDAEPQKCQIEIPVGWHDPVLSWWRDGAKSGWRYDPGDGSEPIAVELAP